MAEKVTLKVGTGFDDPLVLSERQEVTVTTPFGATSATHFMSITEMPPEI